MYLYTLLLVAAILSQEASGLRGTSCNCGWVNRGRIVGGKETKKHEYPFTAGIYDTKTNGIFCGAAIITVYHALTAAHCNIAGAPFVLLVGAHNYQNGREGTKVPIDRIISHPNYEKRGPTSDDIAVIVTRDVIPISQNVGPACMPTGRISLDNQKIQAIGWGMTGWGQPGSPVLRVADLTVIPYETCKRSWSLVTPRAQICTLDSGKSTCHGDSGGPLVWLDPETNRYTLVAVTSYGDKCQTPPPAVDTEVGAYLEWIKNTIDKTKPVKMCVKV